jgi:GxxExxY protein
MPILPKYAVEKTTEQKFHELDYAIMRIAFDVHNQLGRFYDEKIYQNKLLSACRRNGIETETEFEVKLTHKDFSKSFFIDLLLNRSSIYELKTIRAIQEPQRIQTLDYLFMTDTNHGKIINFRPPSVEHEFVSTSLNTQARHSFKIIETDWSEHSEKAARIRTILADLLDDWGAFLNTATYQEAICHFLGGGKDIVQPIEIRSESDLLGHQKTPLLSQTETFCLTSVVKDILAYKTHLLRFMSHTRLEFLYWINFNRFEVQFTTLNNRLFCP